MNGKGRPARSGPAEETSTPSVPRYRPMSAAARDRAAWLPWARALIEAGEVLGPLPTYGSRLWLQLGHRDPRRVAACVRAAECWRLDGERLPERLAEEAAHARAARDAEEAAAFAEMAERVRRTANTPTHAELDRRRYGPGGRRGLLRLVRGDDGEAAS